MNTDPIDTTLHDFATLLHRSLNNKSAFIMDGGSMRFNNILYYLYITADNTYTIMDTDKGYGGKVIGVLEYNANGSTLTINDVKYPIGNEYELPSSSQKGGYRKKRRGRRSTCRRSTKRRTTRRHK
jgi:hypothetical protein